MQTSIHTSAKQVGRLFVFEGSDGVGKSTISEKVAEHLRRKGFDVLLLSFPGKEPKSLGELVYKIHHDRHKYGIEKISAASLQALHIAAHIDCIENRIRPAIRASKTIILDRYWWSTMAYGLALGIPKSILDAMVDLERTVWGTLLPEKLFLVTRHEPFRAELDNQSWARICSAYQGLYEGERGKYPVTVIENSKPLNRMVNDVIRTITNGRPNKRGSVFLQSTIDPFDVKPTIFIPSNQWLPTKSTEVFDTYWRFAAERQSIFFKRLKGEMPPWTRDQILQSYKFTNAYRASDRVSQYLIRHVIYKGDYSPDEVFFRIILFKTFNKIETWELLLRRFGQITWQEFDLKAYEKALTEARSARLSIYSGAYIMPSGGKSFGHSAKHSNHLRLLQKMMKDNLPSKICDADSMQSVFDLLRSYPMIGDFLAYQYATDINYSELTDFSEMSFVVPGPGARDGLQKCFSNSGGYSEVDLIRLVADRQEDEFKRLGLNFQDLWGRRLQLIDCQNLFCEVDKYARVAHPEVIGISGRNRIKQKFRGLEKRIQFFYPPKWSINKKVSDTMARASGTKK